MSDQQPISTTDARQGVIKRGRALKILTISLILAIVALTVVYIAFFPV